MVEIFGTLGPACSDTKTLTEMFRRGMTGMRLNMSHTSLRESAQLIDSYRLAAAEAGVTPELLIDLQGGELRLGKVKGKTSDGEGQNEPCVIPVPSIVFDALEPGDELLIDDGKILLKIEEIAREGSPSTAGMSPGGAEVYITSETDPTANGMATAQFLRGGEVKSHKSVKIVGKELHPEILTAQDRENILLSREFGVTAIMQPFVTCADELKRIRDFLNGNGLDSIRIFAKIESLKGIENLDEIIPLSDMIVIARGDLGNAVPLWELPKIQKQIAQKCKNRNKPFLVVTQMLASMLNSPVPTRAEVSDIYNAVLDGASAVMVTNETAVGSYPVEVIDYLAKTVRCAE